MIIQCQGCHQRYNIDEKKIPAGVKQGKCKICGGTIMLSSAPQSPASLLVNTVKSCPKCGCQLDAKKQEECPVCGIIFKRYKEVEARKKQEEQRIKAEEEQRRAQEEEERKANIVNCLVCKKEISKNAESCPNCGEPFRKNIKKAPSENNIPKPQQQGYRLLKLIIGGVVLIFIVSIFTREPNKSNKTLQKNTTSEMVSNSAWDGSVYQVKSYLENVLKDPDSFEAIEWSTVQNVDTGYMVRCKYRARNSYGGYVIENKIFILNKSGNVISVVDY